MVSISLGAGHQPMDLILLIYIDTVPAKGKGRGRGMVTPGFFGLFQSAGMDGIKTNRL
jgi:hypothetical protein